MDAFHQEFKQVKSQGHLQKDNSLNHFIIQGLVLFFVFCFFVVCRLIVYFI